MTERIPPALLQAVQAEHAAVRPLAPPWRRALYMAPLGVLLVFATPLFWGFRANLALLGFSAAWGLSALQAGAGLWILGAALREAVPGRTLSRAALGLSLGAALALELGVTFATSALAPNTPPPGAWVRYAWECFGQAAVSGLPLLAVAGWLAARALPERPALAGALYGLGAALVADAGVRLFCWVTEPAHVLVSHGAAILAAMGLGAAAALLADRRRRPTPRRA